MKAETERTGFFRRLAAVFTRNWGLKLLALALAVIVYHSLKTENGSTQNPNDRHLFQYR